MYSGDAASLLAVGRFLLTVGLPCLQLHFGGGSFTYHLSFFLRAIGALLLTAGALLLTVGKCF